MLTAVLSASVLLAGCSTQTPASPQGSPGATGAFLEEHGLSGDAVKIVDQLEKLGGKDRPTEFTASVRPDELLLSDGTDEVSMPLPEDRFYLSIAPYAAKTHDCYFHSLTTCQGEMSKQPVRLRIVDTGGSVLVDQETTTNANGFVGTWLPRGSSGTVEVTTPQGSGSQPFATGADDPTCMTTLKLA